MSEPPPPAEPLPQCGYRGLRIALYGVVVFGVSVWSCFDRLGEGMLVGDEAWFAYTTEHMLESGDYVVPSIGNAYPHLNAAPLFNWCCCLTANFAGDTNHDASSDAKSITITKADASITVNGYSGVYDGAAHGAAVGGVDAGLGEAAAERFGLGVAFVAEVHVRRSGEAVFDAEQCAAVADQEEAGGGHGRVLDTKAGRRDRRGGGYDDDDVIGALCSSLTPSLRWGGELL